MRLTTKCRIFFRSGYFENYGSYFKGKNNELITATKNKANEIIYKSLICTFDQHVNAISA